MKVFQHEKQLRTAGGLTVTDITDEVRMPSRVGPGRPPVARFRVVTACTSARGVPDQASATSLRSRPRVSGIRTAVTRLISMNLSVTLIYDNDVKSVKSDGSVGGPALPLQEIIGIGLAYQFKNKTRSGVKTAPTGQ